VLQPFSTKADAGSSQTAKVSVTPNYGGLINTGCDASAVAGAQCTVTPANPVTISANTATTLTVTVNLPNTAAPATYQINLTVADSSGQPSHALPLPITVIADFSLNSATPAQSVNPGQTTGPYQLTIAPNPPGSSFTGAVTLSCSGLPAQAQCLFSPSTPVTPGNSTADVVMNISTTAPAASLRLSASHRRLMFYAACLLLPGIALSWVVCRRPRQRRTHLLGLVVAFLPLVLSISMLSCGGVSNGGGGGGSCSSIPSVPTGLAASSTTSTTTTLTWTASAAGSGCSVTYPVYENSTLLATPANATFNVSGLSAGTQYSFAVGASDSYGVSTPSAAISVTTLSSGTPVGTYVITVTATSGTLSHSATVTLIVD
jgi:hypothetical protein